MRIELDTTTLNSADLSMLRVLDNEQRERENATAARISALEAENRALREQLDALTVATPTRDVKDRVRELFDTPDAMYTVQEAMQKIKHDHYGSVYGTLSALRAEGFLDSTTARPIKFYKKANGNPELRDALPKGTKLNYLG